MARRYRVAALVTAAVLGLAGCGGGGGTTGDDQPRGRDYRPPVAEGVVAAEDGTQSLNRNPAKDGGSLSIGTMTAAESLDPAGVVSSQASVMRAIYDSLFVYDEKGNVTPELAKSIETTDDGKTWVMKLPTGVKFSDGTDFNAEAVVHSLERVAGERSLTRSAGDIRAIESMTAEDPETVRFVLKEANANFPKVLVPSGVLSAGMISSPAAVDKEGAQFGVRPVGAGPFMVTEFTPGGEIVMKKNPHYRIPGKPHLDELRFVPAADSNARLSAVVAGTLDMAQTQTGTDLRSATDQGLVSLYQPDGTYYTLLMNLRKAPFDDERFRKAIAQSIDNEALNDAVFDGLNTPMDGMFPPSNPYYLADSGWPTYNPEEAKATIEALRAEGKPVDFTMSMIANPDFQKQGQIVQQMLTDAGINVTLRTADQPTQVTEALSGNFDVQLRFVEVRAEVDHSLRTLWHSGSRGNSGGAGDPEVDRLLDELQTTAGQERKVEIYNELQQRFAQWVPVVPLSAHRQGMYVGPKVGNFPGFRTGLADPDYRELWTT
ncbi:ABC transporter substrate-binding protein [Ammonicoccus fulvus]|uniref:ABC transporter substrate-binding protein n=1 Tax=Ammonicoccus fulvus TaxID=3138240 RepID=A0ABZ3FLX7_9ACTN